MEIKKKVAIAAAPLVISLPAAAATDYTSLTSAFSSTDIVTGLLAIGAVLATIYTAWRGIKMVIGMMKAG